MSIAKSLEKNKPLGRCVYMAACLLVLLNFLRFILYPICPSDFPTATSWWKDLYSLFQTILLDIVLVYFVSYLQVYLPEQERKRIIKTNLKKMYHDFKFGVILTLMEAGKKKEAYGRIERLFDIKEFNKFFSQDDWETIRFEIRENPRLQQDVVNELIRFRDRMYNVLVHIDFSDDLHLFLEKTTDIINDYKSIRDSLDLALVIRFLELLFAGRPINGGQLDQDHFEDAIDKW